MKKKALITGVTGQDGSYLAEFLLQRVMKFMELKGEQVLLILQRIDHLYEDPHTENANLFLHYGDLTDSINLMNIIQKVKPEKFIILEHKVMLQLALNHLNIQLTVML